MQRLERSSQETKVQPWDRSRSPSRDTHNNIFECFADTETPIKWRSFLCCRSVTKSCLCNPMGSVCQASLSFTASQSLLLHTKLRLPELIQRHSVHIVCAQSLSCVQLSATPWTAAHQAPLSMGFSRQEYWSALPCSTPRNLPDPEIEPKCPAFQAHSLPSEPCASLVAQTVERKLSFNG